MKWIIKHLIRAYYRIMYRIRVEGIENYPLDQGKILCPNHINLHDPVVIGAFLPDYISFMAKKEAFKYKIFNWFLYYCGGFPVDRDGADISAVKTSLKILKSGRGLLIFAEGTRNYGTTPLEAKPGVAMLAVKAQVPIVPVTVDSTYRLFSTVKITIHPPVSLEALYGTKPTQEILQAETQQIINRVYDRLVFHKGRV